MLSHISFRVTNLEASVSFYLAALAPLSFKGVRFPTVVGLGQTDAAGTIPELWLRQYTPETQNHQSKPTPVHVSFCVNDRILVDEFHAAGVAAGGTDNGGPGERSWMKGYYGERHLLPQVILARC